MPKTTPTSSGSDSEHSTPPESSSRRRRGANSSSSSTKKRRMRRTRAGTKSISRTCEAAYDTLHKQTGLQRSTRRGYNIQRAPENLCRLRTSMDVALKQSMMRRGHTVVAVDLLEILWNPPTNPHAQGVRCDKLRATVCRNSLHCRSIGYIETCCCGHAQSSTNGPFVSKFESGRMLLCWDCVSDLFMSRHWAPEPAEDLQCTNT